MTKRWQIRIPATVPNTALYRPERDFWSSVLTCIWPPANFRYHQARETKNKALVYQVSHRSNNINISPYTLTIFLNTCSSQELIFILCLYGWSFVSFLHHISHPLGVLWRHISIRSKFLYVSSLAYNSYGIEQRALKWFDFFVSNRQQNCLVNSELSGVLAQCYLWHPTGKPAFPDLCESGTTTKKNNSFFLWISKRC